MPRYKENRHPLQVLFTVEEFENLQRYAAKSNKSMSEVAREFVSQGLTGNLTQDNVDFLTPLIREQLKSVLTPMLERVSSLQAKACIQAGAAAYLSAEALASFVPISQQKDFLEAYEAARKKAVQYMRKGMEYEQDDKIG